MAGYARGVEHARRPSVWARAIADAAFRDALIADPLRALADAPEVEVSAGQVRALEAMTPADREEVLRELLREAMTRRARQQWGDRFWSPDIGMDAPGDDPPA
jgi:hypothetical protein